jgi:hypothetical protein
MGGLRGSYAVAVGGNNNKQFRVILSFREAMFFPRKEMEESAPIKN